MLTMAGGELLSLSRFSSATWPPKEAESAHEASTMAALGAAALAYSASMIASVSSPLVPGLVQLLLPVGGAGWICVKEPPVYDERPNTERNDVQSAVLKTFVSSSTTMVWPCPEMPAVKSGLML